MKRKRITNYILMVAVVVIVAALAYSISLVYNQQQLLNTSIDALDRIIVNVEKLESERNRLEVENIKLKQLEDRTAEELKGQ